MKYANKMIDVRLDLFLDMGYDILKGEYEIIDGGIT